MLRTNTTHLPGLGARGGVLLANHAQPNCLALTQQTSSHVAGATGWILQDKFSV